MAAATSTLGRRAMDRAFVILLHKLVQSVPRVYVTDFLRARFKEHEMESSLLKASTSQFAQLALLKQKLSRAERERDMYEHASKLSFPTTTRIPSRGQVKWKTTTTENALCWALDAHGMQGVVVVVDIMLNGESASITKPLQSVYLRAYWDEHELESEIRASSSRCSWDKQSRLLRLKHARALAEIECYNHVVSLEEPTLSQGLSSLSEEGDGDDVGELGESDGYFSDESLVSSD
ncbi:hypothetical protein FIBSPDRAFT_902800 [Athelia psychrophila]|uniref:Uncharacterized protein n=1 Tax=Athelia psychrophila TaxID=1759441 RepID=A0A167WS07_9AGAM|nr:hypothetical protein FIBSPDRAFT_902800 [Fibularhizoctonia sp. CBS 109695]